MTVHHRGTLLVGMVGVVRELPLGLGCSRMRRTCQIENSGIGEYSCTRLLKEMETFEHEDEDEALAMIQDGEGVSYYS
jgi:hypothetical protein